MKLPQKFIEALANDYARAYFKRRTEKSLFTRLEKAVMALAERVYKTKYVEPLEKEERKMAKKKGTKKAPKKMK